MTKSNGQYNQKQSFKKAFNKPPRKFGKWDMLLVIVLILLVVVVFMAVCPELMNTVAFTNLIK